MRERAVEVEVSGFSYVLLAATAPVKKQVASFQHRLVVPLRLQDKVIEFFEGDLAVEGDVFVREDLCSDWLQVAGDSRLNSIDNITSAFERIFLPTLRHRAEV